MLKMYISYIAQIWNVLWCLWINLNVQNWHSKTSFHFRHGGTYLEDVLEQAAQVADPEALSGAPSAVPSLVHHAALPEFIAADVAGVVAGNVTGSAVGGVQSRGHRLVLYRLLYLFVLKILVSVNVFLMFYQDLFLVLQLLQCVDSEFDVLLDAV